MDALGIAIVTFTFILGVFLMAKLGDVQTSIDALAKAVSDLSGRIPAPQPPPAATEADLDGVKAAIDAQTAAVNALAPTV